MQNIDHPTGESVIQRRDLIPAGYRQWKESDMQNFGISIDELARRCVPGAFIRVAGQIYFSRGAANALSRR